MEQWEIEIIGEKHAAMLRRKTVFLLLELRELSKLTFEDLYVQIAVKFPAPDKLLKHSNSPKFYITSAGHLRKLACGDQYLGDEFLPLLAQWMIEKKWSGKVADFIAQYQPKTPVEKEELKNERERYLDRLKVDWIEDAEKTTALFKQDRRKIASELDDMLRKMMPAGFSYADTLYMVNAWLKLNPPAKEMTDQSKFPLFFDTETAYFHSGVDVSRLPSNFVMHEHQSEIDSIYKIEFSAYPSIKFSEDDSDS